MKRMVKNKGFTIVELVTVIAIIGLLALILVPTLLGAVADSRIASANQSAKEIRDRAQEFLTLMDTKDSPMIGGETTLNITAVGGWWEISGGNGGADWQDGVDHWNTQSKVQAPAYVPMKGSEMLSYMADSLFNMYDAYIEVHCANGRVLGVTVIPGAGSAAESMPLPQDFREGTFSFGGSAKAGMVGNTAMGTAPVLALGEP